MQSAAAATDYELSAGYAAGLASSLQKLGWLEEVLGALPPPHRDVFANPAAEAWWAPAPFEAASDAVLALKGERGVETVGKGIVVPAVHAYFKISLTLFGSSPQAVLGKFPDFSKASMRGASVTHEPLAPTRSAITIRYPREDTPRSNGLIWKGAIDRALQVIKVQARTTMEHGGGTFRFVIDWS